MILLLPQWIYDYFWSDKQHPLNLVKLNSTQIHATHDQNIGQG